jgi:hypothetical protein
MDSTMVRRLGGVVAGVLTCSFSLGCTSDYMPRPGPRVSMVMDSGKIAYVRDGRKFEGGFLGGDIEEAVRGNPQAEEYASAYKTGMVTGFALTMIGAGAVLGGAVLAADESTQESTSPVPSLVVLAGALAVELAGVVVTLNAQPHLYDAINAYNDGPTGQPAGPVGSTPAPTH